MKVLTLEAQNFKRLEHVKITPDSALVQITGVNRAGKSSVLDALFAALDGGASSRLIGEPIHTGQKIAFVRVELGDVEVEYVVTRTWTKNDVGTLTIDSPRGARYSSPQKILDQLVGKLSMDPLAFARQKGSEQVATLIEALGGSLGFDPVKLEADHAKAMEDRKLAKRDAAALQARFEAMPVPSDDTPEAESSAAALMAEFAAANDANRKRAELVEDIESYAGEAADAEKAIEDAKARLETIRNDRAQAMIDLAEAADEIDVDEISERIKNVDAMNAAVRDRAERTKVGIQLDAIKTSVAGYDSKLDQIVKEREDGLAAADLPYEGLGFDESGVTLNKLPFNQASKRERLIASFALATALNPELRVARIDDGESLDSEGLALLQELAEKADTQVWFARVTEDTSVGFRIVDGNMAEGHAEVAAAVTPDEDAA